MRTLLIGASAFLLTFGVAGCSSGNAGMQDAALAASVQSKLNADTSLQGSAIKASAENGVVTLTGSAPNEATRVEAAKDAQIQGVAQVNNEIATNMPASDNMAMRSTTSPRTVNRTAAPSQTGAPSRTNAAPAMSAASPIEVERGTSLHVRLSQALSSETASTGETFSGTVADPVLVNGRIVIPKGAQVTGTVVEVQSAGHFKGQSSLELTLSQLAYNGQSYALRTSAYRREGASRGKRSAVTIGGGAGVGALIGALAGHGKGAAIGAAVGAGAGTAAQAMTKPEEVTLPAETALSFTLSAPVQVVPAATSR